MPRERAREPLLQAPRMLGLQREPRRRMDEATRCTVEALGRIPGSMRVSARESSLQAGERLRERAAIGNDECRGRGGRGRGGRDR
jgi:hypothetical protein